MAKPSAAQRHRRLEFHDPSNPDCRFSADPGVASPDADWCSCPIPEQPDVQSRSVPLMEGLRNLTKGYDRKFALSYCADDVWKALEALERIANHDLRVDYADCELRSIARRALA